MINHLCLEVLTRSFWNSKYDYHSHGCEDDGDDDDDDDGDGDGDGGLDWNVSRFWMMDTFLAYMVMTLELVVL